MMIDDDVIKWKKRLNRKGPFYLLRTEADTARRYAAARNWDEPITRYVVIWNDGPKTKIGAFQDYMLTRYGVSTWSVLNGETPFDLWNGSGLTQNDFDEMLKVRKKESELPTFNLATLIGVTN